MRAVLVLLVTATTATAHAAPTGPEVAAKVQAYYAHVAHLHAAFRQEVINPTFGVSRKTEGTVWLARPLSMDWENVRRGKVRKQFVSDGKTLWIVDHDNLEIIVSPVGTSMLPASAAFLFGGDLAKTYDVTLDASGTYGAKGDVVLALAPRTPQADVKRLILVVDPADDHVKDSIVIDTNDNVNHIMFDVADTSTAPPASIFTVSPKALPRYKVVTPRPATPRSPAAPSRPSSPGRRPA